MNMNMKDIHVMHHAMDRFRERCFEHRDWSDERISRRLTTIARKGEIVRKCHGRVFEVKFENIIIRAAVHGNQVSVITCLGNQVFNNWDRRAKRACLR